MFPPKPLDPTLPLDGGCSEGLDAFRFFLNITEDLKHDKKLCDSTSNGTDQYQNGSSNLLTPYIESSLDRLGLFKKHLNPSKPSEHPPSSGELLSPTHDQRSQQQSGQITLQPVLINKSKFLKAIHRTEIRKIEIPRSMVVEASNW